MPNARVWYCRCRKANGASRRWCRGCHAVRPDDFQVVVVEVGELLDSDSHPQISGLPAIPAVSANRDVPLPKPGWRLTSLLQRVWGW